MRSIQAGALKPLSAFLSFQLRTITTTGKETRTSKEASGLRALKSRKGLSLWMVHPYIVSQQALGTCPSQPTATQSSLYLSPSIPETPETLAELPTPRTPDSCSYKHCDLELQIGGMFPHLPPNIQERAPLPLEPF